MELLHLSIFGGFVLLAFTFTVIAIGRNIISLVKEILNWKKDTTDM